VRSLDYGGAQRQLIALAKALNKNRFNVSILAFYAGALELELEGSGVQVISLNKTRPLGDYRFLQRLIHQVRLSPPDVLHG